MARSGGAHLTLKFLGDVGDDSLPAWWPRRIARPLCMGAGDFDPRRGAFPNFRRARVVWIGVEQERRLELLHHDLEIECESAGFEVEGRPFRPHVTLARVRSPLPRAHAIVRPRGAVGAPRATVPVERITLFESTLAPSGARYRRVHSATLGGR